MAVKLEEEFEAFEVGGVFLKPRLFAYIVAAWLVLITGNVILAGYYDIALRDLGLALGALALGRLSETFDR